MYIPDEGVVRPLINYSSLINYRVIEEMRRSHDEWTWLGSGWRGENWGRSRNLKGCLFKSGLVDSAMSFWPTNWRSALLNVSQYVVCVHCSALLNINVCLSVCLELIPGTARQPDRALCYSPSSCLTSPTLCKIKINKNFTPWKFAGWSILTWLADEMPQRNLLLRSHPSLRPIPSDRRPGARFNWKKKSWQKSWRKPLKSYNK